MVKINEGNIEKEKNVKFIINSLLEQEFGSNVISNVTKLTYGCTRDPSYGIGEEIEFIAEMREPKKGLDSFLANIGMFNGRAFQEHDFLFIGRFKNDLEIDVFPQYKGRMIKFAEEYEKKVGKEVIVNLVKVLDGEIGYNCNLITSKENSY